MADEVSSLLRDGYAVAGYSTTIMAAGAMTHSILLQKQERMVSVTVVTNAGKEIGRTTLNIR